MNAFTKKALAISTLIAAAAMASNPAAADDNVGKKAFSFSTGVVAGFAAGGPVGAFIGAVGGALVGESFDDAEEEKQALNSELAQAHSEIAQLESDVSEAKAEANRKVVILDSVKTDVLFDTAAVDLDGSASEHLAKVVDFLKANPYMKVRLDGFADPRGNADYNRKLSQQRMENVRAVFEAAGISADRIEAYNHGESQAKAGTELALERRVSIELSQPVMEAVAMN